MADSAIVEMARGDFLEVEALHTGIQRIRAGAWTDTEALLTIGGTLEFALANHPMYDPNTGMPLPPNKSAKAARQIGAYFRRAAHLPGAISAELAAAWTLFDRSFKTPAELAARQPNVQPARSQFRGLPTPPNVRRAS